MSDFPKVGAYKTIEIPPGTHIREACEIAVEKANDWKVRVCFSFNGHSLYADPGNDVQTVFQRWQESESYFRAHGAYPGYVNDIDDESLASNIVDIMMDKHCSTD
jgi:hypothetical protein